MYYHEPGLTTLQKTGVITQDAQSRVIDIHKKPQQSQSNWPVHPFYIYRIEDIPLIFDYLAQGWKTEATGNLVRLMYRNIFDCMANAGKKNGHRDRGML